MGKKITKRIYQGEHLYWYNAYRPVGLKEYRKGKFRIYARSRLQISEHLLQLATIGYNVDDHLLHMDAKLITWESKIVRRSRGRHTCNVSLLDTYEEPIDECGMPQGGHEDGPFELAMREVYDITDWLPLQVRKLVQRLRVTGEMSQEECDQVIQNRYGLLWPEGLPIVNTKN